VAGITLTIDAGEIVGVVGPSGAGKSTLVQLLLRLRVPSRGTITVSGIPYEDIEPSSWHRLVALVPQDPKLFGGSVHDNIAFHRPGITRERVEQAAAAAHVAHDVRELPEGFDTMLGPRGTGLSGGQKQRVAIARALVGEPQLVVLDEPTSALDTRSEQLLLQTIEELEGRVTMVIVAHRLTTLARCDRLLAMNHGHLRVVDPFEAANLIDQPSVAGGRGPRRR
jgi:ABC-type multidrug transport system fused ATPase/permease subunit